MTFFLPTIYNYYWQTMSSLGPSSKDKLRRLLEIGCEVSGDPDKSFVACASRTMTTGFYKYPAQLPGCPFPNCQLVTGYGDKLEGVFYPKKTGAGSVRECVNQLKTALHNILDRERIYSFWNVLPDKKRGYILLKCFFEYTFKKLGAPGGGAWSEKRCTDDKAGISFYVTVARGTDHTISAYKLEDLKKLAATASSDRPTEPDEAGPAGSYGADGS